MNKTCQHCEKDFVVTDAERALYGKTKTVEPDICFYCRVRQHFAFWVFGKFRKGKSDLSGESLITVIPENVRYPIYSKDEWFSDKWVAMDYGVDYDPSIPFFDQLKNLQSRVPRPHQTGSLSTGCEWSDDAWQCKNCYLSRSMLESEDITYGYRTYGVKNSIDVSYCFSSENCYDCTFCFSSYNLNYSRNCKSCVDSYFLYDCRNCTDCFMCYNVSNKSYCILNQQYTKEEYKQKIKEFKLGSFENIQKLKKEYEEILQSSAVHRATTTIQCPNCTGNYITNCEGCINTFQMEEAKNTINNVRGMKAVDSIDITGNWVVEMSGNLSCCTEVYDTRYSVWCDKVRYSEYLDYCHDTENCFGCVGLRKKKFCILNKQYSEDEYNKLRSQIINDMKVRGEYGKFPPYSMGLCSYNLTTGVSYLPDTNGDFVKKVGGIWEEIVESSVDGMEAKNLPDDIADVAEDIYTQPLICPVTGWRYNIANHELEFYKQKNIPLPREHFDVRTKNRLQYLTVIEPFMAECIYCGKETVTYSRPEWNYKKIACESCYLKEIM